MQVVITVAGHGQRFVDSGYSVPKPLIPLANKPAIQYLIESFASEWKLFFVLGKHLKNSELPDLILKIRPKAEIIFTRYSDRGPIDTVLAAVPHLNAEDSVAVSYCDYAMVWDPIHFENFVRTNNCDMSVISYHGWHPTFLGPNTYAHLQLDTDNKKILKIQEKKLFGDHIEREWTSAGFYYFRNLELLQKGLQLQLQKKLKHGNEYYTSLAIQALIEDANQLNPIQVLNYQINYFIQMGTPADIQQFEKWYQLIKVDLKLRSQFGLELQFQFDYWNTVIKTYSISSK